MTTIMQIYLTILISIIFVMIVTGVIACIFSGPYYYDEISDVLYTIFKITIIVLTVWVFYLGIAFIWHLY